MMDAFLQTCGVLPALEMEVEPGGAVPAVRYSLPQPFAIVGRHPAADVQLDADGIRPRHLYFQAIEGRVACVNVSQSASFLLNGKEVKSFCWLPVQHSVQIGSKRIKLLNYETDVDGEQILDNPLARGSALDIFAPRLNLELTSEDVPGIRKTWPIDRLLTLIGRTERCAIQLNHEQISNVHCSLVLTTTGLWVVDLLGRGGILINDEPVRMGSLGVEDELRLGPYRLRLHETPEPGIVHWKDSDFRPLTPVDDFEIAAMNQPDLNRQGRQYPTPWLIEEEEAQIDPMESAIKEMERITSSNQEAATPIRSATSLLEDSDSSVFRIPSKTGIL